MLERKSQARLSLLGQDVLYAPEMSIGRRIRTARKAVKGLTQAKLGAALGVSDKAVSGWERDEDRPTGDKFPVLAEVLGVSLAYLHGRPPDNQKDESGNIDPTSIVAPYSARRYVADPTNNLLIPGGGLKGDVDLPVFAIVQGGQEVTVLDNEPFTQTARPRRLAGNRNAYGVLVRGHSMAREYNENDIAYVDPNLHPKKGDPCVFQGERPDGTVEAKLKYLERSPDASPTVYYVSQTNPPKKFTLKKADWQKCHVAVGKESGR